MVFKITSFLLKIASDLTIFNAMVLQISSIGKRMLQKSHQDCSIEVKGPKFADVASLVVNQLEAGDDFIASLVVNELDIGVHFIAV